LLGNFYADPRKMEYRPFPLKRYSRDDEEDLGSFRGPNLQAINNFIHDQAGDGDYKTKKESGKRLFENLGFHREGESHIPLTSIRPMSITHSAHSCNSLSQLRFLSIIPYSFQILGRHRAKLHQVAIQFVNS
jgi:hypothetical protein